MNALRNDVFTEKQRQDFCDRLDRFYRKRGRMPDSNERLAIARAARRLK